MMGGKKSETVLYVMKTCFHGRGVGFWDRQKKGVNKIGAGLIV